MITRFNREELAQNLPDAYKKDRTSNNAKILDLEKHEIDLIRKTVSAIYDSLDIDRAYGKTLDLYGEMIGQLRGAATDEQYRVLIKNRIIRNFSNSDHNSIVNAICVTFGCDPSDILLTETGDSCKVSLEGLPISKINESNIDIQTAIQIVRGLIPVGVYLEAMNFSGTFEFSEGTSLEYDEAAGFADELQTIGGYFGLLSDGSGKNLPV